MGIPVNYSRPVNKINVSNYKINSVQEYTLRLQQTFEFEKNTRFFFLNNCSLPTTCAVVVSLQTLLFTSPDCSNVCK